MKRGSRVRPWLILLLALIVASSATVIVWRMASTGSNEDAAPERADVLVELVDHGGLCPDGRECESRLVVLANGEWQVHGDQGDRRGKLANRELEALRAELDSAPLASWSAAPPPDQCGRDVDGSSPVYGFHPTGDNIVWIDACEHKLPADSPLLIRILDIFRTK